MRTALTYLAVIACVVFLASGHFYWKEKTNVSAINKQEAPVVSQNDNKRDEPKEEAVDYSDLLELATNWPEEAQATFGETLEEGRTYKIAIVGSAALGKEANGWSEMLKEELIQTFGESNLEVSLFEYSITSTEFIEDGYDKEVAALNPDLVLFEPFNLNDNTGWIPTETNHENILTFISALKDENSKAVLILQPPHPIVSTEYPKQVGMLKTFADEQGIPYLDHWSEWPGTDDEQLRDYLISSQSGPNEKGHEIWYEFLKAIFIAK